LGIRLEIESDITIRKKSGWYVKIKFTGSDANSRHHEQDVYCKTQQLAEMLIDNLDKYIGTKRRYNNDNKWIERCLITIDNPERRIPMIYPAFTWPAKKGNKKCNANIGKVSVMYIDKAGSKYNVKIKRGSYLNNMVA
jgi:hypothetical protein